MEKIIVLFPLILFLCACSIVGPGQRGVRVILGAASSDVKAPGPYLWVPFVLGMAEMDVQVQKSEIKTTAASKDMQEITTELAVNWSLNPDKVVETYKNVGDEDDILKRIIVPAVNEVMKAATSKRTAEEILSQRLALKADIDAGLKDRLEKYGLSFGDVSIVNLAFSQQFTQAIEEKQIAEQKSKQAVYEKEKATQDALAAVETAKGQQAAQNLVKASITAEILQQRAIEKWDGHFPQVMGGNGTLPFLNIKLGKSREE